MRALSKIDMILVLAGITRGVVTGVLVAVRIGTGALATGGAAVN